MVHPFLLSVSFFFDIFNDFGPFNLIIPLLSEQRSYTTRNVFSEQLIFPFTEQALESSRPQLLDDTFGMIFLFPLHSL